jgi:hypothetical protein
VLIAVEWTVDDDGRELHIDELRAGPITGWCDWCGTAVGPLATGGCETVEADGRTWCGLCPRFPATKALHEAARCAQRAERLLHALEPERLAEFAAELDGLRDQVNDLQMVLEQRQGRPPPSVP